MATEQRGIRLLVCNRVAEQIWQYRNCDSEQREIHRKFRESENGRAAHIILEDAIKIAKEGGINEDNQPIC